SSDMFSSINHWVPSFWKSRLAKTVSEPFIVGYPTRIARQRQLLCLELGDRFAPGPRVSEIGLERVACLGLLPAQCGCRDQYQRSIGVAVWGQYQRSTDPFDRALVLAHDEEGLALHLIEPP